MALVVIDIVVGIDVDDLLAGLVLVFSGLDIAESQLEVVEELHGFHRFRHLMEEHALGQTFIAKAVQAGDNNISGIENMLFLRAHHSLDVLIIPAF